MDLLREEALERRHKAGKRRGEKDLFVLRVTHKTALNPSGSLQPLSPAKRGGGRFFFIPFTKEVYFRLKRKAECIQAHFTWITDTIFDIK